MDVPIEEEGGTNIHEDCEGGKRRRLMKVRSVVDWVEDVTSDTEDPNLLSEGDYVIRLSNTERQIGDPALENRDCIVATNVDDKGKVGRLFTLEDVSAELSKLKQQLQQQEQQLQQRTSTLAFLELGLSEPVVCAEAFKLLEKDFSSILKNMFKMTQNADVVDEASEIVTAAAKRQNWPIASAASGWVGNISFGVFAEAVLMLNDAVTGGMAIRRSDKEKLGYLKDKLTDIFWSTLDEGICVLEENESYVEGEDSKVSNAITFLRNKENLVAILHEWIAHSYVRTTRNATSHPFGDIATKYVKAAALEYYGIILDTEFSKEFRHVAELGRLKLNMDVRSSAKKRTKGGHNDDIKAALHAMYGMKIDEPAGSGGSSNSGSTD